MAAMEKENRSFYGAEVVGALVDDDPIAVDDKAVDGAVFFEADFHRLGIAEAVRILGSSGASLWLPNMRFKPVAYTSAAKGLTL